MKYNPKNLKHHQLLTAWAYADHLDKSTEWMFQYMSDYAKVEYDEAVDFVCELSEGSRQNWYRKNPSWIEEMTRTNEYRLSKL